MATPKKNVELSGHPNAIIQLFRECSKIPVSEHDHLRHHLPDDSHRQSESLPYGTSKYLKTYGCPGFSGNILY